jgi:hypothetical protein
MIITRRSPVTGKVNSLDLNITDAEIARWQRGEFIQNVWPNLTVDEREFLMTGMTKEDWDETFKDS